MRDTYDVVVVGAGPAGGIAARDAAARGLRTLLVEEHAIVGCPGHCTGKLSLHAFREFGLPAALARNTLAAGRFVGPLSATVDLRRASPDSYVVDRAEFDAHLAAEAQAAGADLLLGTRITGAAREGGRYALTGQRNGRSVTLSAGAVVSAEGARPTLPGLLGLPRRRRPIRGLQYDVEGVEITQDAPEVFFGHAWAPGFFAWMMPLGGGLTRVGLAVDPRHGERAPSYYLDRFVTSHPSVAARLRGARVVNRLAGFLPILDAAAPSARDGVFVAGDAAGHVKSTTGGGIYFAMVGARLAAEAAARYLDGDRRAAAGYDTAWRRRFGRELRFTGFGRRLLNRLADPQLDRLLAMLAADEALRRAVERAGDTAWQSRLAGPLLRYATRVSLREPAVAPIIAGALVAAFSAE